MDITVSRDEALDVLEHAIPQLLVNKNKDGIPEFVTEGTQFKFVKALLFCRQVLEDIEEDFDMTFGLEMTSVRIDKDELKKQLKGEENAEE